VELFVPTKVIYTFTYNSQPLPLGTEVSLSPLPGEWENFVASGTVDSSGQIVAPSLTALNPQGPLSVGGFVGAEWAGKVDIGVMTKLSNLSIDKHIVPFIYKEDVEDPSTILQPHLMSCNVFDYTMTVKYYQRPLVEQPVTVEGFGFTPTGVLVTDTQGRIRGNIQYSINDLPHYLVVGDHYSVSFNGLVYTFPGPKPVEFLPCQ
jgi:hypothetical protein